VTFDYYREKAAEAGWEAGPQHLGYLFHVHVEETEELAWEVGRKIIDGPGNLFLNLSRGNANFLVQNLPGLTPRKHTFLDDMGEAAKYVGFGGGTPGSESGAVDRAAEARGAAPSDASKEEKKRLSQLSREELEAERDLFYTREVEALHYITGTPDSVIPKIRTVLETLRPGQIFLWDGDGDQTHEETMRSMRLMGEYVLPAVREIGEELELESAFSIDPKTNQPIGEPAPAPVA
jgi:alkanesulfonate monooxygenase SsuD/methylene tetrahydromethanopterin reductase-like flavin-dependent oxidoreductase (luciferase family)